MAKAKQKRERAKKPKKEEKSLEQQLQEKRNKDFQSCVKKFQECQKFLADRGFRIVVDRQERYTMGSSRLAVDYTLGVGPAQ